MLCVVNDCPVQGQGVIIPGQKCIKNIVGDHLIESHSNYFELFILISYWEAMHCHGYMLWNLELKHRNRNTINWNLELGALDIKEPFIQNKNLNIESCMVIDVILENCFFHSEVDINHRIYIVEEN